MNATTAVDKAERESALDLVQGVGGFDYQSVDDAAIAGQMRSAAIRIRQHTRAAYIEVGRDLRSIKSRIEHGKFVAWVERECEINIRTAQRMMAVVELLDKNDTLSFLPPTVLTQLAQPSAPKDAVDAIVARIDAGERPKPKEILGEIWQAKERERQLVRHVRRGRRKGGRLTAEERARAEAIDQSKKEERERAYSERNAQRDAAAHFLAECLGDRLSEAIKSVPIDLLWDVWRALSNLARARAPLSDDGIDRTPLRF
jgi:Protein of unknown function (DUF3102)